MITKTLDDVMRRILNDSDIFSIHYPIFDNAKWQELHKEYLAGNGDKVKVEIEQKIKSLKNEPDSQRQEAIKLTDALKNAINKKPHILEQMFSTLDKFGLVKCNLPNMEDYGKVIENHKRSVVEQFFLYKIDKEKDTHKKGALRKTLEYLKELYAMNIDILESAFFIRKLNSLTEFFEVIKDE